MDANTQAVITNDQQAHILEAFQLADEDKKGYLNKFDLKVAMVSLFGYKPSGYEIQELMSKADHVKHPGLTINDFLRIASAKLLAQDPDDQVRQIFQAFDLECRGFITLDNAKRVFNQVAPFVDSKTVEKIFREVDGDRDARVSFRDFEFMMKYFIDDS